EAADTKGNLHKSEIQHVFVEDDGAVTGPPPTPGSPEASVISNSRIDLSWNAVADASGYHILRHGANIAKVSGTSYSDSALSAETTYIYALQAFNGAGTSGTSPTTTASTPAAPDAPEIPTGLTATALSASAVQLSWEASNGATEYRIRRDGMDIAQTGDTAFTDSGLGPASLYRYSIVAGNAGGYSGPTAEVSVTTPTAPPSFTIGDDQDPSGYLVEDPGMRIFAAVRGTLLYLATWTPSGGVNDHFILVSDRLESDATSPAPWGKAGTTAQPPGKPFLGAEADNQYAAWFNLGGEQQIWRDTVGGGRVEGVIDLVEAFETLPEKVYITALAYGTADGAALAAQAPAGNGDGNIDSEEFYEVSIDALRDSLGSGVFDRLDPGRAFKIRSLAPGSTANELTIPVVPGKSYRVLSSATLEPDSWTELTKFTADHGVDEVTVEDQLNAGEPRRFYKIESP
ncbi:MAG TPA: fibronectin type III domain-containing protein, partial [Opitutales bacterium]|nr:fibronectin type III domain-containing protein [Opitutales bacterium]